MFHGAFDETNVNFDYVGIPDLLPYPGGNQPAPAPLPNPAAASGATTTAPAPLPSPFDAAINRQIAASLTALANASQQQTKILDHLSQVPPGPDAHAITNSVVPAVEQLLHDSVIPSLQHTLGNITFTTQPAAKSTHDPRRRGSVR